MHTTLTSTSHTKTVSPYGNFTRKGESFSMLAYTLLVCKLHSFILRHSKVLKMPTLAKAYTSSAILCVPTFILEVIFGSLLFDDWKVFLLPRTLWEAIKTRSSYAVTVEVLKCLDIQFSLKECDVNTVFYSSQKLCFDPRQEGDAHVESPPTAPPSRN